MSFHVDLPPVALPGPRPLPLLGARGNLVRFLGDPVPAMLELHAQFGDVVPLTRNDPSWLLAFGPELNRQILSDATRFHNFADNPIKVPPHSAAHKFSLGLVNQNGEVHRHARRRMLGVFGKARLRSYAAMMVDGIDRVLARHALDELVDLRELSVELSLTVALRCLFGIDLSRGNRELGELVLDYLGRVFSPVNMLLPFDLPGLPYARFMATCEQLGARIEQLIAVRREQGPSDDMLSALIESYPGDGREIDDELLGQTALMLVAGHETTAHTLAWTLILLTQHPALQLALAEELDAAGVAEQPELDGVLALPLLDRVLKESMRLLPAVPLLFFRRSTEPFSLHGHELPVGATIVLSPLVTHRWPATFADPRRFDPDRWLELAPTPYEYMPFGAGPRMCLGASFGTQALRLALAMILRRWLVEMHEGVRVSYKTGGVTMGPKRGVALRLRPRDRIPARVGIRGSIHELVELPQQPG